MPGGSYEVSRRGGMPQGVPPRRLFLFSRRKRSHIRAIGREAAPESGHPSGGFFARQTKSMTGTSTRQPKMRNTTPGSHSYATGQPQACQSWFSIALPCRSANQKWRRDAFRNRADRLSKASRHTASQRHRGRATRDRSNDRETCGEIVVDASGRLFMGIPGKEHATCRIAVPPMKQMLDPARRRLRQCIRSPPVWIRPSTNDCMLADGRPGQDRLPFETPQPVVRVQDERADR